jgi:hypothetical protein
MAAVAAFMLMLGIHGHNGAFSLTEMANFASRADCQRAASAAKAALGSAANANIEFVCVAPQELETLMRNSSPK